MRKIKELAKSPGYDLEFKNFQDKIYLVILRADPKLRGFDNDNKLQIRKNYNPGKKYLPRHLEEFQKSLDLNKDVVDTNGIIPGAVSLSTHLDVVDVIKEDWGLRGDLKDSDGNYKFLPLDPWKGTEVSEEKLREYFSAEKIESSNGYLLGDRIYGRGTEDNKGSIASTMAALAAIQQANIPLKSGRDIYLLIETTEESTWTAMIDFKDKYKVPQHNIGLDSKYPVVTGEKGYGAYYVTFPLQEIKSSSGEQTLPYIESVSGGSSTSQIPQNSNIVLVDPAGALSLLTLQAQADEFSTRTTLSQGKPFQIEVTNMTAAPEGRKFNLRVKGKSKSAYLPEEAINPVTRAFHLIDELAKNGFVTESAEGSEVKASFGVAEKLLLQPNEFVSAAKFVVENYGYVYDGSLIGGSEGEGVAFTDPFDKNGESQSDLPKGFTGSTTVVLTRVIKNEDGSIKLTSNTRIPMGVDKGDFRENILGQLNKYTEASIP